MSNGDERDTSGLDRTLDTTNFDFAELSSNKETIWSDYFLKILSSIPRQAVESGAGKEGTGVVMVPIKEADAVPALIDRVTSLEGKVADRPSGNYQRKFFARESFRGLVAESEGNRFSAIIQDRSGDRYEYVFSEDELPERQRKDVRVGSPIVVHIGYEYRGSTKTNLMKIYLASYEKRTELRAKLIEKKAASWNF
ncbi:hypothetical protein [Sinorhizobium americanum]|nr:hypothetical protein [Sinorhizobium americanum]